MPENEPRLCVICGSIDVIQYGRASRLLGLKEPFRVLRCAACGLSWLNPFPTQNEYQKLYEDSSYFVKSDEFESYDVTVSRRLHHFMCRISRIKALLPGERLYLLDVGSATGAFVAKCRDNGINAIGLDISPYAVEKAIENYGPGFYQGELLDIPPQLQNLKFNVVHLNHTFEHFLDPVSNLTKIRDLLQDHGVLIIEVPYQFDNIIEKLRTITRREKPVQFEPFSLHHPFFYTPKSLCRLVKQYGFRVDSLRTYDPTVPVIGKTRIAIVLKTLLLRAGDLLANRGDIIEIYARKT
jgi:SAM-dependent methyltransferase